MKMNIGIFGGSFDPVHLGHIEVAAYAKSDLNLDKVIFVPAGCPQLKPARPATTGLQRLEMVKMAIENEEMFDASDIEITRKGPTFTIDTIKEIKDIYPSRTRLWLIVGADAFREFNKWENYQEILNLSRVCVVRREGNIQVKDEFNHLKKLVFEHNVVFINKITQKISSSKIKEIIRKKEVVKKYLNPKVHDYIVRNGLYRTVKDT